jgi:ATPase family AAA domain-containing protein 1
MSVGAIYRSNPGLWLTLVKLGISIGVSMALTKWLMKMMEPMIDPHYKQKKEAEKSRETLMQRLGHDNINTNHYEDLIAQEAVNPAGIDVTFMDIGGLEEEEKRLRELVVLPFARPELFARGKLLRPPKGVLLYGPPGTGKTMLAKAIAKETKAVFLNISLSTLQDKWFGESQKLVRAVFTLAWKLQPAIVFIDEISLACVFRINEVG